MQWLPRILPKKCLGIDIGTAAIKIVEMSAFGDRRKLENYGEISAQVLYKKPFRTFEKSTLLLFKEDVSKAILAILEEAKIKTKEAFFSLPDFSSFFTSFELPPMTKDELPQAVRYEARQYVPLPLSEVTLDWQIIEGRVSDKEKTKLKILLVAVPNEVINQYRRIAQLSGLQLISLEAEVFALARSLIGEEKRPISIIDIGAQSTTCSIIEKGILKISHSFDLAGNQFTERTAQAFSIEYQQAEDLKRKYGLSEVDGLKIEKKPREILLPLIDLLLAEVEKIFKNFSQTTGKEIQKIILAGGTALLPGLKEYFQEYFRKEIEIANPFLKIFYPPILEKTLKEMGPSYAIAVGLALRGFE